VSIQLLYHTFQRALLPIINVSDNEQTSIDLDAELAVEFQQAALKVAKATATAWEIAEKDIIVTHSRSRIKFFEELLQEVENRKAFVTRMYEEEVRFVSNETSETQCSHEFSEPTHICPIPKRSADYE
jgi:hypothetical protein